MGDDYNRNYHFKQGVLKLQLGQNSPRNETTAVNGFYMHDEHAEPPAPSSDEIDVEAVLAGALRQAAASRSQ